MEKIPIGKYAICKPEWFDETLKELTKRQVELLKVSINAYFDKFEGGNAKEYTLAITQDTGCRIIMIALIQDIEKQIKSQQPERVRASKEYAEWRANVFRRDEFTCKMCGKVGGKLNAHHIKPFSKFPELRFDIDNGITLCEECHRAIHKKEG